MSCFKTFVFVCLSVCLSVLLFPRRSSEKTLRSWPNRSPWRYARGLCICHIYKCLFVIQLTVCFSVSVPLLLRKNYERTLHSWTNRSPWRYARGLFIYLTYKCLFVYLYVCIYVSLSVCLLALFYQVRAQKGNLFLGQTEVCGDTREVCSFVFNKRFVFVCISVFMSLCLSVYPFVCLCPSFTK